MPCPDPQTEINQLFSELIKDGGQSVPELSERLYKDLRRVAQAYMRKERPDHTLQATALVNEAYLRVFQGGPFQWKSSKHLLCLMAQVMRRVLVDHARGHHARKRGGTQRNLSLDEALVVAEVRSPDLFALHDALERLSRLNARQAQVVDLRFLAGLTVEETAAILGVSAETVKLDWRLARAWLQHEIGKTR
jgi:RNA polymerase sigma factor (TIGR02999 family)